MNVHARKVIFYYVQNVQQEQTTSGFGFIQSDHNRMRVSLTKVHIKDGITPLNSLPLKRSSSALFKNVCCKKKGVVMKTLHVKM